MNHKISTFEKVLSKSTLQADMIVEHYSGESYEGAESIMRLERARGSSHA